MSAWVCAKRGAQQPECIGTVSAHIGAGGIRWALVDKSYRAYKLIQKLSQKYLFIVTPAKAGVQGSLKVLDSGFRRNDARRGLMHFEIDS